MCKHTSECSTTVAHLHLRCRHARILGISAVILPAHSTHRRCNSCAFFKLVARRRLDKTNGFNAQNSRKWNTRRVTLTGKELRSVQTEGLNLDENLAARRSGNGACLQFQDLWTPCTFKMINRVTSLTLLQVQTLLCNGVDTHVMMS